jgi:hypothetical protein
MRMLGTVGTIFGLALWAALPAKAATLDFAFSFTGTAFSGTGDITVNAALDSLGGHDILGINGSILGPTGGAITGLKTQPGTPNAAGLFTDPVTGRQWIYNDVLYSSGVPFDYDGVLFSFGTNFIGNLYSIGTQLYFSVSNPSQYFYLGDPIRLEVSQTPLPPALPMFLAGLGGLWLLRRYKSKGTADSGPEFEQLAVAA